MAGSRAVMSSPVPGHFRWMMNSFRISARHEMDLSWEGAVGGCRLRPAVPECVGPARSGCRWFPGVRSQSAPRSGHGAGHVCAGALQGRLPGRHVVLATQGPAALRGGAGRPRWQAGAGLCDAVDGHHRHARLLRKACRHADRDGQGRQVCRCEGAQALRADPPAGHS